MKFEIPNQQLIENFDQESNSSTIETLNNVDFLLTLPYLPGATTLEIKSPNNSLLISKELSEESINTWNNLVDKTPIETPIAFEVKHNTFNDPSFNNHRRILLL